MLIDYADLIKNGYTNKTSLLFINDLTKILVRLQHKSNSEFSVLKLGFQQFVIGRSRTAVLLTVVKGNDPGIIVVIGVVALSVEMLTVVENELHFSISALIIAGKVAASNGRKRMSSSSISHTAKISRHNSIFPSKSCLLSNKLNYRI